MECS
jgi:hypothetical protein